jgi:hypothetical protein
VAAIGERLTAPPGVALIEDEHRLQGYFENGGLCA